MPSFLSLQASTLIRQELLLHLHLYLLQNATWLHLQGRALWLQPLLPRITLRYYLCLLLQMHHQGLLLVQVLVQVPVQVQVQVPVPVQVPVLALPFRMLQQKHLLFFLTPFYRPPELQALQIQEVEPVLVLVKESVPELVKVQKLVQLLPLRV